MKKIRKAVVPVAGYGTRFLPVTKALPKEMLPVVDKPVVQYVVEELADAGIEQIIFVTSWHKRAIEDHFDRHLELETKLESSGKTDYLDKIKKLSSLAEFVYVRQKEQRGNGDAILAAEKIVGDEPFLVLWGDDFVVADPSRTTQLIEAYNKYQSVVLGAIEKNKPEDADKYAYVKGKNVTDNIIEIDNLIEKPGIKDKPSDLAIVAGSVMPPEIFKALREFDTKNNQELVYVDGVNALKNNGQKIYAVEIKNGTYYDCGNILEYLKTNIDIALQRDGLKSQLKDFIREKTEDS